MSVLMTEGMVQSPCVSICALDENDICVGCFRSGGEISRWGLLSNDDKREVLLRAGLRMVGELESAPCLTKSKERDHGQQGKC